MAVKKRGIPPTVCNFQLALTSKLTQYDQKETAREVKRGGRGNFYRLGHLLEAAQKIEDDVKKRAPDCNVTMTPEIAAEFRAGLRHHFAPGFRPAENIEKQLDAFLATGKNPTLLGARSRRRG